MTAPDPLEALLAAVALSTTPVEPPSPPPSVPVSSTPCSSPVHPPGRMS
jgi:hypothetical protein